MAIERQTLPADPEFGHRRPGPLTVDFDGEPEAYLRLMANPFLALAYLVLWMFLLYQSVEGGFAGPLTPTLVVTLAAGIGLVPFFVQFHCLDCGQTDRISRWRKHVCQRSMERRQSGNRRRIHGPTPIFQVVLWIGLIVAVMVMLHSMGIFERSG